MTTATATTSSSTTNPTTSSSGSDGKRAALQILHDGVSDLMSSAGWRKALAFRQRFHAYSFFKTSLILAQQPDARLVAGYRT